MNQTFHRNFLDLIKKANRITKTSRLFFTIVLLGTLLLTGCDSNTRVGELQSESISVEIGDARSVSVEINLGASNLELTGGTVKLMEAGFIYNVARLKPEVEYTNDTLVIRQPEVRGLPALQGITDYRNEWNLHLNDEVPMDLSVDTMPFSSGFWITNSS